MATKYKAGDKITLEVKNVNYIGEFPAQYEMTCGLRIPVGSLDAVTIEEQKPAKKPAAKKTTKKAAKKE